MESELSLQHLEEIRHEGEDVTRHVINTGMYVHCTVFTLVFSLYTSCDT